MTFSQANSELAALLETRSPPLRPLPEPGSPMVVYGGGNRGREAIAVLLDTGYTVPGVLDQRADTLGHVDGIPCVAPTSATAHEFAALGLPVVVAVFNYAADIGAIVALLQETGFQHVITFPEFVEHFPSKLSAPFWIAPRSLLRNHADDIIGTLALFGDDRSREIYVEAIKMRINHDFRCLRNPDRDHQYFPQDLPLPVKAIRMIDGGAFTGDTIREHLAHRRQLEAVAAFEPDVRNFKELAAFARSRRFEVKEMTLFPCALGERTEPLTFNSGLGAGSRVTAHGNTSVQVVALDDVLPTFDPTLIKLDIEGAEPSALRGAAIMIDRSNCYLAVCVYHAPDHLWSIPQLMHRLAPNHRLALRHHQYNGFDIVAYAFKA